MEETPCHKIAHTAETHRKPNTLSNLGRDHVLSERGLRGILVVWEYRHPNFNLPREHIHLCCQDARSLRLRH